MAEPPGAQPALGIDAVEWLSTSEHAATVIVTGRWRRRPSWQGRPVLVIEAEGRRHRFPATPEPPSVTGAMHGTWRMTFSIPAWLAPYLSGHSWLQFGGVVVALPAAIEQSQGTDVRTGSGAAGAIVAPPGEPSSQEQPPGAEEAPVGIEERARQRAEEVLAAAAELGQRIQQLEAERRAAEERAQAELARRLELEEQHAALVREADRRERGLAELASANTRIRELEQELADATRRAEEAEELAGRADAERDRLLRELAHLRRSPWRARLPAEMALMRREPPEGQLGATPIDGAAGGIDGPRAQQARAQLRREYQVIESADVDRWRRRNAELEQQLRDQLLRAERLYEVIDELRRVIDALRGISPDPGQEQVVLEDHGGSSPTVVEPVRLDAALARLRQAIPPQPDGVLEIEPSEADTAQGPTDTAQGPTGDAEGPTGEAEGPTGDAEGPTGEAERAGEADTPAGEAEREVAQSAGGAERATAALAEPGAAPESEAPPAPPSPTRKSWLLKVLRRLAKEDPAAAGRLVLELLAAQGAAYPRPIEYDLALADLGCVSVGTGDGTTQVVHTPAARELSEVDFRITGELGSLARLLIAGRVRRRLGRRRPRVQGKRKALSAPVALVRTPLGLADLYAAGVRLDARTMFVVVALMIDPKWTSGHRFTIAHRGPSQVVYLRVTGEGRPSVTERPPLGPVATTIVSDPEALLPVLVGESPAAVSIRGGQEPLELLREWVRLAQRS